MAAVFLSKPGEQHGPCIEACAHIDCEASRADAASVCGYCNNPIGYGVGFYNVTRAMHVVRELVHATCEQAAYERDVHVR
jgi:hypothetical protein